jgi:hypothetical protein
MEPKGMGEIKLIKMNEEGQVGGRYSLSLKNSKMESKKPIERLT